MANKYKKGKKFEEVMELMQYMLNGGMVYFHGKVYSPAWLLNWAVIQLKRCVNRGVMYEAVLKTKKEEIKDKIKDRLNAI